MFTPAPMLQGIEEALPSTPSMTALAVLSAAILLALISMARVFERAGMPAWGAFVPIYNAIVLLRISGLSPWWIVLLLVPVVNVFLLLAVSVGIARKFQHSNAFAAGLWLLPFVFYPILAFGSSEPVLREA